MVFIMHISCSQCVSAVCRLCSCCCNLRNLYKVKGKNLKRWLQCVAPNMSWLF